MLKNIEIYQNFLFENFHRYKAFSLRKQKRECILCSKDLCTWKHLLYDCEKTKEYVNGKIVENIDVVKEIKGDIKNAIRILDDPALGD